MRWGGNGILDGLEEAELPDSTSAVLKKPVGEVAQDIQGPARRPQCLPSPPMFWQGVGPK